jgi:E3 ubiquitin-protein ligase DOA10
MTLSKDVKSLFTFPVSTLLSFFLYLILQMMMMMVVVNWLGEAYSLLFDFNEKR